ncbi:MAG: nickel-dependent lactate racemase [Rhodospirillales bacterium]|nr:nickel-dependent lactate racemase [Rhodospirillales bacterium]
MHVDMNYDRGSLAINVAPDWRATVLRKPAMPVLADPSGAVAEALDAPLDAPGLREAAAASKSACVLICDITRPVPNGDILPVVLRTLLASGMPAEAITVLVATGLHRPNEGEELLELVGDRWVLDAVRVANHFARRDEDHVEVGTTRRGNVIKLDRRFVEADLRLAIGLVEPHFMAGYSGGRKIIAPGVAHADTITTFHSARYMEDPNAANCVLQDNPLHEDQLEVVRMVGGAYAINTVIDDERRMSFVNYGEIIASHLQAVAFTRAYTELPVPERYPTVVTSSAGYPLDKTYYQTVKGMVGPLDIMAPNGNLIVVSACSEGMGSPDYVAAQRRLIALGPDRFLASLLEKRHADVDEWQAEKQLAPMRAGTVSLYTTGLDDEERALTGVRMIESVEAAITRSVVEHGDPRVAFVPEGPYIVPQYAP